MGLSKRRATPNEQIAAIANVTTRRVKNIVEASSGTLLEYGDASPAVIALSWEISGRSRAKLR
jgi:hypothetical protein